MKQVTLLDRIKLYGYIEMLKLRRKKRDYDQINQDYDKGVWNKDENYQDLESWGENYTMNGDAITILTLDGKLFKGKRNDYFEKYYKQLDEVLEQYKNEPVVELGCGLGHIVLRLHKLGFKNLAGYDLSSNAISLLKKYCNEKGYDMIFDVQDLNKPFPKGIIENKIVFTHTCMEQLKNYMPNVLKNIIDGKPKLVINFEVDYDNAPFIVKQYFDARDYQNNLVKELKKLEKQGKVGIISRQKFSLTLSPTNRPSTIIWKPVKAV